MTDDLPSATDLLGEVVALSFTQLQQAMRAGRGPSHPLRARLDAPERLATLHQRVADLHRRRAGEVWRAFAEARDSAPAIIAARQTEALAQAWERLGDGVARSFHVRGHPRLERERLHACARDQAPQIAIDPNPGSPKAHGLAHPGSIEDAVRFAAALPLMRRCEELGARAVGAFDALGQPTHALARLAAHDRESPQRAVVWRLWRPRSAASRLRMLTLTATQVVHDLGDAKHHERLGLPGSHCSEWRELETLTLGALAWRLACEHDARVRGRDRARHGSHMVNLRPEVVGRPYRELDDPFTPLLTIGRLGCRLHAFSREATTFELCPTPGQDWRRFVP
ncbi:hypothetical protein OV203_35975 [Nannocystis sp. ILAH1]|uniref:hypothetical protein n=1 Tax=Nannocystis sp. ILAH1 TaxID=2996789 RepID=UPI00226DF731|nr:hypothetical protein [Nannocystis sp. ILAH1]MCY0992594.1 hypothetical protein [Nannocystis sp. ILAH1]